MPTKIRYAWPLLLIPASQLLYNIIMAAFLGNFDSKIGDWLFARDCNYGWCDGNIFLVVMHSGFLLLFLGNAIHCWRRS